MTHPAAALILATVVALGASADGRAQPGTTTREGGQQGPPALWKTFPLRPRTVTTPVRVRNPPRRPRQRQTGDRGSRSWSWILVGTAMGLFATTGVVVSLVSSTRRGGDMDKFKRTRSNPEAEAAEEPSTTGSEEERSVGASRVTSYLAASQSPSNPDRAATTGDGSAFDDLGEHVSSVLNAAKDAAARIRAEAQERAEQLLVQTNQEAESRAEAARAYDEATRSEAQKVRSEAEQSARQTRAEAEADAAERRAAAEAEARRIVAEAEEHAASVSKEALRRQQVLKMDLSVAEDRLRKLAMGLYEVAGRLDGLLAMPLDGFGAEPSGDESSLMDDLAPGRETEEASM